MPNVMVIDDNRDIQDLLQAVLAKEGYDCAICGSAEEAKALCQDCPPDLAILDICLPGQDGLDFCAEMRTICPMARILLYSAVTSRWSMEELRHSGANAVALKGAGMEKLIETVRYLLKRTPKTGCPGCHVRGEPLPDGDRTSKLPGITRQFQGS